MKITLANVSGLALCFRRWKKMSLCHLAQWVEWLWNWPVEHWAIRSSACLFARTTHSFAYSAPHCSLHSRAVLRSFAHSLAHSSSRAHGKEAFVYQSNASISYNFNPQCLVSRLSAPLSSVSLYLLRIFVVQYAPRNPYDPMLISKSIWQSIYL